MVGFVRTEVASGKHELGWTLWDIYKLAAARVELGVATYAIVGAPVAYWIDESVDCSALYVDGTWDSAELFVRYERAWSDLLGGGPRDHSTCPRGSQHDLLRRSAWKCVRNGSFERLPLKWSRRLRSDSQATGP